jgi:hypothetical protein
MGYRRESLQRARRDLQSEEWWRRVEAARWVARLGRKARSVEPLLREPRPDAFDWERAWLAMALWRVQGSKGAPPLRRALAALENLLEVTRGQWVNSSTSGERNLSIGSFWSGPVEVSPVGELTDIDSAVFTVLERLRSGRDAVADLSRSLREKNPYVRLVAAVALSRAKPDHRETVPALKKVLERQPWLFVYAAAALADLGPRAAPLAPWLQSLLRHPDADVSRAAERVLRRISPALAAKGWWAAGALGETTVKPSQLWEDLAGADPLRADLAVWRLAAGGSRTIDLLRERLRPPPTATPERINRLVKDLDSDQFSIRQRAGEELARLIETAAPALRRARAVADSLEVQLRLDRLLASVDRPATPEHRRRLRALRLLEEMGGPEAKALLTRLFKESERAGFGWQGAADALKRIEGH